MDDLLNNTYRALGLKLDRDEAASLISMLDVDGDQAIQCNELEVGKPKHQGKRAGRERVGRASLYKLSQHPVSAALERRNDV